MMRIAVQGCCHGELPTIYKTLQHIENSKNIKIDLLLICGDFQSIRNLHDLNTMSVPDKFKELGEFYKYYNQELVAPIPTIFIGGNHEASNYLWELFYGGWVWYVNHLFMDLVPLMISLATLWRESLQMSLSVADLSTLVYKLAN